MKRLSMAVVTIIILTTTACNQKSELVGSVFGTDNSLSVQADSMSASMNRQVDSFKTSSRAELIAQLEEQVKRQLSDEELAELDSQLSIQIEAQRSEVYHLVDSVRQLGPVEVTLTFRDDRTLEWKLATKGALGDTTEIEEAQYVINGNKIIATFGDEGTDTLILSDDGNEIVGPLRTTYSYTLKKRR